jgi:hypothetical protein
MSSEGPYGRQGFQSNPNGYGGTYGAPGGGAYSPYGASTGQPAGYDVPPAAAAPGDVYGASYSPYGGYQVGVVAVSFQSVGILLTLYPHLCAGQRQGRREIRKARKEEPGSASTQPERLHVGWVLLGISPSLLLCIRW